PSLGGNMNALTGEMPGTRRGRGKRRTIAVIAGLLVVMVAGVWLYSERERYLDFQAQLTSYEQVKLGTPMIQIKYALGQPKWVLGPMVSDPAMRGWQLMYDVDAIEGPNVMPKGKTIEQYDEWEWDSPMEQVKV